MAAGTTYGNSPGLAISRSRSPLNGKTENGRKSQEVCYGNPDRETWWRIAIRDTPVPGTYEVKTFVEDLDATPISKTYGFKSHGRKKDADPSKKGKFLMPGLYKHKGFVDELKKRKVTYNFKGTDRNETAAVVVGIKDKEIAKSKVSPTTYSDEYKIVPKLPIKDPVFKSQSRRFPTIYFTPKEGPAPGQYEAYKTSEVNQCLQTTAPFKSKTPRFVKPHVLKTPGPGAYTKMIQTPMPSHIKHLGRHNGLFFTPGVY